MNLFRQSLYLAMLAASSTVSADNPKNIVHIHYEEEIVVSAPFNVQTADTAMPVEVLLGERLQKLITRTLGETLNGTVGVHNGSFGPGVGLPIIRGQSGTRVEVLQNSVSTTDVSTLSPDHGNAVEPALAERIEVIRGPATLLYGNGAVGGVVNVIDGNIPESEIEKTSFLLEQSYETAAGENKTIGKLSSKLGSLNFTISGFTRKNDDVEIPGYAIDESALDRLSSEDGEEINNSKGFIANSDGDANGGTIGMSFTSNQGFFGFSGTVFQNEYGLPPGLDHGDEESLEDTASEQHEDEEGQEFVRLNMDQNRYNVAGGFNFSDGWIRNVRGAISYTDYEHQEIEIESSGEQLLGTLFENRGLESRFTLSHEFAKGWDGVLGLQHTDTEFEATGDEAFIPKTREQGVGIFLVERFTRENVTWEFGARVENISLDPDACDQSDTARSLSLSSMIKVSDSDNIVLSFSRSERSPTIEERYSNVELATCEPRPTDNQVLHAATGLFETGNPFLDTEKALNYEIGFKRVAGPLTWEVNTYYNDISDYIYLDFVDIERAVYAADDATFYGAEGKLMAQIFEGSQGMTFMSVKGDIVRAELEDAGDVPRIPPGRLSLAFQHFADTWSAELSVTRTFDQSRISNFETETDGYTNIELYADYHWPLVRGGDLRVFVRGTNLLDSEIRNHGSVLKSLAPEQGRGIRIGVRLSR